MAEKMTNGEGSSGTVVSRVEDDIHIDPTSVSRSIYVTGFLATTKSEELIIHFQRKKNGGGDIDGIIISKRGAAVITFDSPEVVQSVVQQEQEFQGVALKVKPYEETMTRNDHNFEVFELVSAELCLETVELLTREQTKTLLKEIAGKTGIEWIDTSESFTMSGAFKQVEMSRTYLQQAINQTGGISEFTRMQRKKLQPQKRQENESHFSGEEYEEDLNQTSPGVNAMQNEENLHEEEPNETHANHVATVKPSEIHHFEVEPKFIKVFVKAHETEISDIEAEYHVKVPREAKEGKISLTPKDVSTSEEYDKACNLFIDLYQQMTQIMKMERFSLKDEKNVVAARKKIHEMSKKFPILVEVGQDKKHWELYGEHHDLEAALEFLKKEKVEIKRESKHGRGTEEFQGSRDYEEAMDVDPPNSANNGQSKELLETSIGKVKVSVYKGDLTSEEVDVIVNAANDRLQHLGGVAKAILDSGGKVIEKESNKIIKQRGSLKDGEAVATNAGRLPCKKVVHAVGPEYRKVGLSQSRLLLRQTCLNSFKIAQELKMTSIALPAISSGIYGMPKDACAEVMFDAVEEFARQGDSKKKTITDIRFVNIDDPTVQAFKKEFVSRFGDNHDHSVSKSLAGGRAIKVPPTGAEGANSSAMSTSRRNRGKNKSISDNSRTTTTTSSHHHSTNSAATADHPLSGFSNPSSSDTSYSRAVKKSAGDNNAREPTSQESGGAGITALHLPPGGKEASSTTDRKEEDPCPICLDTITSPQTLKCKHAFCSGCLQRALKTSNKCPVCQEPQGVLRGNQPPGEMRSRFERGGVPGYEGYGTIVIDYHFPSGIQGREHPNPGQWFGGTSRTAYLPDTREGREVLQLLRRAFDARLVFTIGTSNTTGLSNQITWNDIHHKTSWSGGPYRFGYPDPDYLRRVKEELAAKGIR